MVMVVVSFFRLRVVLVVTLLVLLECLGQIQSFLLVEQQSQSSRRLGSCRGARPGSFLRQQRRTLDTSASTTTVWPNTVLLSDDDDDDNMRLIQGIRDIVDDYDVFLLDMWGVMHDGTAPYEGVVDVVQRLADRQKTMIVLSNSSKRTSNSVNMLQKLGFNPSDFHAIITSGEVAYQMLSSSEDNDSAPQWEPITALQQQQQQQADKKKVFILGSGDGDREYCASCGWSVVPVEQASMVVARGTFTVDDGLVDAVHKDNDETAYEVALHDSIAAAAARQLPMLVCNPDKVRPDVGRPPMPGYLGDLYVAELQKQSSMSAQQAEETLVKRIGKPFGDVYQMALASVVKQQQQQQRSSTSDSSLPQLRVCMVGDALETDVTGGAAAGVDTLWVLKDGIHSDDLPAASSSNDVDDEASLLQEGAEKILQTFNQLDGTYAAGRTVSPDMIAGHFRW